MHHAAIKLAVATATTGLLLLLPDNILIWPLKSIVVGLHVLLAVILAILLIKLVVSHAGPEFFNPFKEGYKKWNGFKLFIYLFIAILTGIPLLFTSPKWLIYFHGFIGLWAVFVSWRHAKK
ncbi:MAG: hypothetical protein LRY73_00440 [Bacillus sp. (in: Bacteria)]|nr:hypothetical protein [Bacillus sp. (in: firmicutes)]